jgi:hypothetical protein
MAGRTKVAGKLFYAAIVNVLAHFCHLEYGKCPVLIGDAGVGRAMVDWY